ncbi:MAG: SGNH/GDSL hydrolase family protein [bacterium]
MNRYKRFEECGILRQMKCVIGVLTLLTGDMVIVRGGELSQGDFVAVCGDSITEQRRYSVFIEDYLLMCQPQKDLQVMQMGWNGEVTWGFIGRMGNDALPFKPTVFTTCFGMNDAGAGPELEGRGERYRVALDGIVNKFRAGGARWGVIGTPGAVDPAAYRGDAAGKNKALAEVAAVAREVARKNDLGFADIHDLMMDVMAKAKAKYGPQYRVGGNDGVHPSLNGHLIMAYAFLKALKGNGEIGMIQFDMKTGQGSVSEGHTLLSASADGMEIESARYPFCFYGTPEDIMSTRGIIEFLPFNQDLNRFMLVVTHAPSDRMKITWGKQTKTYSANELAKGINLAAEFLDNPFSVPFAVVEKAVQEQQAFEVQAVKNLLHPLYTWRELMPEFKATYDQMQQTLIRRCAELRDKARVAVVPVRHRIMIAPAK